MTIQRFDLGTRYSGNIGYVDIVAKADGKYVLHSDYAALQSQDAEDALIEAMLEACSEWSQYVEVDSAPRTLREHIQLAINHARRIEGEGE